MHNYSNVTFYVELKLKSAKNEEQQDSDVLESLEKNFSLDFKSGIIAANSKVDIGIIFNPTQVTDYDVVLEVIASEKNPKAKIDPKDRGTSAGGSNKLQT